MKRHASVIGSHTGLWTTMLGAGVLAVLMLACAGTAAGAGAEWDMHPGAGTPIQMTIIDPLDEIYEINENNNEIVKEITLDYPDLTIGTAYVQGGTEKVVVTINECGGMCGASDVTVRFESYETEECTKLIHTWSSISHPDAANIQVYFKHLYALDGCVEVRDSLNLAKPPIATYSGGEFYGVWGPWVKGDTVYIVCQGAGAYANITEYRWGTVSDEQIEYLPAGGSERVEIPWAYEYPRNVHVTVDPDNNIAELDEDNNNETVLVYADLRADRIVFVSPQEDKLSLDAEKFVIDGTIANRGDEDGIIVPVSDFDVTLEFRNRYPNGTVGDLVFDVTEHIEEPLYANEGRAIRFEFDPSEELGVGGNYTVSLIADSSGDICESSELYPDGEDNNVTSMNIYVYNSSGYAGSSNLTNVAQGEVHGRVGYTVGDSIYTGLTSPGGEETVRYTGVIPGDAGDIELARIFVYWFTWHNEGGRVVPVMADVNVTFNGHNLTKSGNYSDNPGATAWDACYGMYSYDVTDHVTGGDNEATVRNNADWRVGIHAIGLLVVYEDEDEPLTKYWISEGVDIMMAANREIPTGLPSGNCITTATFEGVERNDTENVNAALLTVLGAYTQFGESDLFSAEGDALKFNNQSIGSLIYTGYWEYHYSNTGIALTKNKWEDVTDYLKPGDNLAEIQSKGNFMMPNNAFLRLIIPPDLNITNLTAPDSIVIGMEYPINATIRNDGRSDAHDFNVTLYIDGKQMVRIPHLDIPAGNSTTLHIYNWTPMMIDHVYNLTVTADILSGEDWTEIEVGNNGMIVDAGAPGVGDLNGDGILTPADAAIALQIAATGAHDDAADVSRDGHVTSLDALMILQAAAGRIEL